MDWRCRTLADDDPSLGPGLRMMRSPYRVLGSPLWGITGALTLGRAARKGTNMALVIILLLLALLLGGLGFAIHVLWWVAIAVFVVFLVSLVLNRR